MGSAQPSGIKIIEVAVPGGALAVEMISSGTEPVLAIHGISSQDHAVSIMSQAGARATANLIAEALTGQAQS